MTDRMGPRPAGLEISRCQNEQERALQLEKDALAMVTRLRAAVLRVGTAGGSAPTSSVMVVGSNGSGDSDFTSCIAWLDAVRQECGQLLVEVP